MLNIVTGMVMGIFMSIPFGPIGALCIHRILTRGRSAGLASGLGVALGDSVFASIAVLGITQVSSFLLQYQYRLEFLGGLLILLSGLHSYRHPLARKEGFQSQFRLKLLKDASGMFLITITNPQTIIGFSIVLISGVRFYHIETNMHAILLVAGIFTGSMLWWWAACIYLDSWRSRLSQGFMEKLHRNAALFLMLIGSLLIIHAVYSG